MSLSPTQCLCNDMQHEVSHQMSTSPALNDESPYQLGSWITIQQPKYVPKFLSKFITYLRACHYITLLYVCLKFICSFTAHSTLGL